MSHDERGLHPGSASLKRWLKDRLRPYAVLHPYVRVLRRLRIETPNLNALGYGRSSFSQFGEDRFLDRHFEGRRTGFYVDVGAFHPFTYSNTCLLHIRGWHGINIEPDPDALSLFERYRPRDLNLQIAIATHDGSATFARTQEYGGIEDDQYIWGDMEGERITVRTRPLAAILSEHLPAGQPLDLLDVDCEGRDLESFSQMTGSGSAPKSSSQKHIQPMTKTRSATSCDRLDTKR